MIFMSLRPSDFVKKKLAEFQASRAEQSAFENQKKRIYQEEYTRASARLKAQAEADALAASRKSARKAARAKYRPAKAGKQPAQGGFGGGMDLAGLIVGGGGAAPRARKKGRKGREPNMLDMI